MSDLKARSAEVESLLKSGELGGIYVPALQAKDLALEIQSKQAGALQDSIEASVKQIVLAAYQLDNYGDLGDAEKAQRGLSQHERCGRTARLARVGAALMRRAVALCVVIGVLMLAPAGDAHKGITSKFTYNADVYPVFLNRCGRCHIDGGVGPMSLLKYEDAFPWAESLRAELLDGDERTTRTISSRPRIGRSPRASSTSCSIGRPAAHPKATRRRRRRRRRCASIGRPASPI